MLAMDIAIITGGSRGLGEALTEDLVALGWQVVIDGRDAAAVHATAARLGPRVHPVPGDVTDPAHRSALVAEAERLGGLDLLVNNASTLGPSPLPHLRDLPLAAFEEVLRTNVVAPLGLIQEALPLLVRSGGMVIDVTSDAAVEGYAGWGGYGASKAALEQLSNVLAAEEPEVRVWWVDPGDMRTQMHAEAFPGEDISDRPLPEDSVPGMLVLLADRPPSGRYHARELAGAPR